MATVNYSILSYYPSIITNENMIVGIAFHDATNDARSFYYMKNWKRLESFDDELDVQFTKKYLLGIKNQFESSLLQQNRYNSLHDFTRYYVNELRFGKIDSVNVNDVDEFIEKTKKVYMRLDYDVSERLSKESEMKYIKSLMKTKNIKFSTHNEKGDFNENVCFDFTVDNYGFKSFGLDQKDTKYLISSAKSWAFTARNMKNMKLVFIYDDDFSENNYLKTILSILESTPAKVLKTTEVVDFLKDVSKNRQQSLDIQ